MMTKSKIFITVLQTILSFQLSFCANLLVEENYATLASNVVAQIDCTAYFRNALTYNSLQNFIKHEGQNYCPDAGVVVRRFYMTQTTCVVTVGPESNITHVTNFCQTYINTIGKRQLVEAWGSEWGCPAISLPMNLTSYYTCRLLLPKLVHYGEGDEVYGIFNVDILNLARKVKVKCVITNEGGYRWVVPRLVVSQNGYLFEKPTESLILKSFSTYNDAEHPRVLAIFLNIYGIASSVDVMSDIESKSFGLCEPVERVKVVTNLLKTYVSKVSETTLESMYPDLIKLMNRLIENFFFLNTGLTNIKEILSALADFFDYITPLLNEYFIDTPSNYHTSTVYMHVARYTTKKINHTQVLFNGLVDVTVLHQPGTFWITCSAVPYPGLQMNAASGSIILLHPATCQVKHFPHSYITVYKETRPSNNYWENSKLKTDMEVEIVYRCTRKPIRTRRVVLGQWRHQHLLTTCWYDGPVYELFKKQGFKKFAKGNNNSGISQGALWEKIKIKNLHWRNFENDTIIQRDIHETKHTLCYSLTSEKNRCKSSKMYLIHIINITTGAIELAGTELMCTCVGSGPFAAGYFHALPRDERHIRPSKWFYRHMVQNFCFGLLGILSCIYCTTLSVVKKYQQLYADINLQSKHYYRIHFVMNGHIMLLSGLHNIIFSVALFCNTNVNLCNLFGSFQQALIIMHGGIIIVKALSISVLQRNHDRLKFTNIMLGTIYITGFMSLITMYLLPNKDYYFLGCFPANRVNTIYYPQLALMIAAGCLTLTYFFTLPYQHIEELVPFVGYLGAKLIIVVHFITIIPFFNDEEEITMSYFYWASQIETLLWVVYHCLLKPSAFRFNCLLWKIVFQKSNESI